MRFCKWLVLIIFLFSAGGVVFGNGVQEDRIAKAKELIAQKDYNEAILLLAKVVKEEPDRLDQAQELLDEIRRARDSFNNDFSRLLTALYTDQDEGKALRIIKEMESTDKSPNIAMQREIAQAKRSARLIYYQKQFAAIMAKGLAALNQKDYSGAISVYVSGYSLARDEFDENNFNALLRDRVFRALGDLEKAAAQFAQNSAAFQALQNTGVQVFEGNPDQISTRLTSVTDKIRELADLRRRIYQDSAVFAQENDLIKKTIPDLATGDFFLSYAYLITRGRSDVPQREGIIGSIDRLWNADAQAWSQTIQQRTDQLFTQATQSLDQQAWSQAQRVYQQAYIVSKAALSLATLWNLTAYPQANGAFSSEYVSLLNTLLPQLLYLNSRRSLALQGEQSARIQLREAGIHPDQISDSTAIDPLQQKVDEDRQTLAAFASQAQSNVERMSALTSTGWAFQQEQQFWSSWLNRWRRYLTQTTSLESSLIDRKGFLEYASLQQRYQDFHQATQLIQTLVDGKLITQGNATFLSHDPRQALVLLRQGQPAVVALRQDLRSYIDRYQAIPAVLATPAVQNWPVKGQVLLDDLNRSTRLRSQLLATAGANWERAQQLQQEGDRLLREVQPQIDNADFPAARRVLNEATGRFSASLNLEDDAQVRKASDAETKRLFALILKGENELVVREVRRLITAGSTAYLTGQFPQAEQTLLRAQARWATTNAVPNQEVTYWLGLAQNALSINTGRTINPTDPLYNEIQALLNFARADYEKARQHEADGDQAGAKRLLDEAQTTLGKVLLPFPLNQEARVLNLRIQQSRDPAIFPTLFRDDFNAAVTKLDTKPQEGYNDLLDLKSIQADYPGLASAIKSARLILGIDRRPPNPADLRESRNLTDLAQRIYDSNNVGQFSTALAQINKALRLDPTNRRAQELKDKLSVFNPTATFMTPSQLNEFNAIVNLFASGRRLEAQSQLNLFLIHYPGLAQDPRVKELQGRMQAAS